MISAWRIDKAARSKGASFSGEGARLTAGRWNSEGSPLVYAASSLSLAVLEKFVHLLEDGAKAAFVSYQIEIPDSAVARLDDAGLPKDWDALETPLSTRKVGDLWLVEAARPVLIVPSVVTRGEFNMLLNPSHPDFAKIKISEPTAYRFDPRMWKTTGNNSGAAG